MARWTIKCNICRGSRTRDTRHGLKTFMLIHGVKCSAKKFNVTEQLKLTDYFEDFKEEE